MKKEVQDNIFSTYPDWFGSEFSKFGRYMDIGAGWTSLLLELLIKLQTLKLPEDFTFHQIKQKFGGLRVYYAPYLDEIEVLVRETEEKASKTCEKCGNPGRIRSGGWIRTLCDVDYIKSIEGKDK